MITSCVHSSERYYILTDGTQTFFCLIFMQSCPEIEQLNTRLWVSSVKSGWNVSSLSKSNGIFCLPGVLFVSGIHPLVCPWYLLHTLQSSFWCVPRTCSARKRAIFVLHSSHPDSFPHFCHCSWSSLSADNVCFRAFEDVRVLYPH